MDWQKHFGDQQPTGELQLSCQRQWLNKFEQDDHRKKRVENGDGKRAMSNFNRMIHNKVYFAKFVILNKKVIINIFIH